MYCHQPLEHSSDIGLLERQYSLWIIWQEEQYKFIAWSLFALLTKNVTSPTLFDFCDLWQWQKKFRVIQRMV